MHCKSFECSLHRIIQAVSLTLLRPRLSSKRFRFWGVTVWWCVCSNDVIAASVLWMQKSVHIICINIRNHSNLSFTLLELGVWQDFHFLSIFPSGVAWRTCGVQKPYFQNLRLTLRSTPCVFAKRASCKIWSLYNILVDCGSPQPWPAWQVFACVVYRHPEHSQDCWMARWWETYSFPFCHLQIGFAEGHTSIIHLGVTVTILGNLCIYI